MASAAVSRHAGLLSAPDRTLGAGGAGASSLARGSPPRTWLLLRGLGREQRHWFDFPRAFEQALGVRAVTLDLPGAGERHHERCARSIQGMARELGARIGSPGSAEPWGVLGISLGGMVALSLANEHAAKISRVVVINTSSRLSLGHQRLRPRALLTLLGAALATDPEKRERRIYALTTNAPAHRIRAWARDAAELARRAPSRRRTLAAQLFAAAAFHAPASIEQPLLVLSGAGDRLVAPACSTALARRLDGTARCHPTAGHDLPIEDPEWIIEQVRMWLESGAT